MPENEDTRSPPYDWSAIIADAIEININRLEAGDRDSIDFVGDMESRDERLYDPSNVKDRRLSAAWNFADSFFDAAWHGFDLDGIEIPVAAIMLKDVMHRLRSGQDIDDPRILRYA